MWINPACDLQPENWGWQLVDGRLEPVMTDLPPAPESLLQVIRCSCKRDCSTKHCTCRKHRLECSAACGFCKGISCQNSSILEPEDELDLSEVQDQCNVFLDTNIWKWPRWNTMWNIGQSMVEFWCAAQCLGPAAFIIRYNRNFLYSHQHMQDKMVCSSAE